MTNWITTYKDLKQGDLLPPLLFILGVDILPRIMERETSKEVIKEISEESTVGKNVCLQFADDTLVFSKADGKYTRNLKFLLYCFELITSLKINYEKTSMVGIGISKNEGVIFASLIRCKQTTFSIRYLSLPLHYRKTRASY